ncbi:ABC transporter permease [Rheinheimera baltica]|uniref:ABC transporter permease n=1 Tax=Rheinheimera baltica TaxID=67576 RepID=UPI0004099053|nr:ABC transporter permease [Rheinheimera baltica]
MGNTILFRYLIRTLRRKARFFALTTAVMSIGLAICYYMYAFIYAVTDKPLNFEDSDNVVLIGATLNGRLGIFDTLIQDFEVIEQQRKVFDEIGAFRGMMVNLTRENMTYRQSAVYTDANAFSLSKIAPVKGRLFHPEEMLPGAQPVMIISYEFWHSFFGAREDILTQSVQINGELVSVIGIFPEGYAFPWKADVYMPLTLDTARIKREEFISVAGYGKLSEGVSIDDANAALKPIMEELAKTYPGTNAGIGIFVEKYTKAVLGKNANIIVLMMSAILIFILFLISVNVGNLLFSNAYERIYEIAVKMALGAPRNVIIVQVMLEGVLICVLSSLLALGITHVALNETSNAIAALNPNFFVWQFGVDGNVLTMAALLLVIAIVFSSFLPAWRASAEDFNKTLREGTVSKRKKSANKLDGYLVMFEVAISVVALIMASALTLSVYKAVNTNYGVGTDNTLVARLSTPSSAIGSAEQQKKFFYQLVNELEALPQIDKVSMMSELPGGRTWPQQYVVEGKEYHQQEGYPRANIKQVIPGSIEALDIKLKSGRYLNQQDMFNGNNIVVSQSFADKYWPNDVALDQRIRIIESSDPQQQHRIVGVIDDVIYGNPYEDAASLPTVYFANQTTDMQDGTVVALKYNGSMGDVVSLLRDRVKRLAPDVAVYGVSSYEERLASNTALMLIGSRTFILFGLVSFILAASGIYGFVTKMVLGRTREVGIRIALGATDGNIYHLFFRQRLMQLFGALGLGVAISILLMNGIGNSINVEILQAIAIYMVVTIVITLMVIVATFLPVRELLAQQPSQALRYE